MDLREEAIDKDSIVRYMLKNPTSRDGFGNNNPRIFNADDFYGTVLDKKLGSEYVKRLVQEISDYPKDIVNKSWNNHIENNSLTQKFIVCGGFVAEYDRKQAELKAEQEAQKVAREKDKVQLTIAKWQKKTFWPVFAFGLIGGLYAVSQFFNLSNNVSQHQLNPTIDSIQNRLQNLEKSTKQINAPLVIDSIQPPEQ